MRDETNIKMTNTYLNGNLIVSNEKIIKRKLWVDSLRAIAMILVVYGHCVQGWADFFIFTSPIKMPLFFIISAYLFNPKNGVAKVFLKNLLFKLVIPWIVLGMLHPTNPIVRLGELISGRALWFMPCLIIGEIVWFLINSVFREKKQIVILGLILSCVGYHLTQLQLLDYAMTNRALTIQFFFVVGFLIKYYEQVLLDNWKVILILGCVVYILLALVQLFFFPDSIIDVHKGLYFNILFCIFIILVGCIAIFICFNHFNICNQLLVFIGQNTLTIYIVHGFGLSMFAKLIPNVIRDVIIPLPVYAFFRTLFAFLLCCIFATILNKYVPELVGKKRKIRLGV